MNKNLVRSTPARASLRARASALLAGAGTAVASLAASASGTGFDSSSITTKITENTATAVLIIGAFILGIWTLRTMGLLKKS